MASGETRPRLFVVSGPSGAGKGTIVRGVLERRPDIFLSVSATTRPARAGEVDGVDYHFVAPDEFVRMREQGEFLEWAQVFDNFYGTPKAPVEQAAAAGQDVIAELDIQGAMMVKRARPDAILVFIEPPSLEDLAPRLRGRGTEDATAMNRRLQAAYDEVKKKESYDHVVVNDHPDEAVRELLRILER